MSRPLPFVLLGLLCLFFFAAPVAAGPNPAAVFWWRSICQKINPHAVTAIDQMCSQNFNTATEYSRLGKQVGKSHVVVRNYCNPKFVPTVWCSAQFLQTCAESNKGFGEKKFDNGCQGFLISKA